VIDKTVAQAFAEAVARGEAPKERAAQLALARSAFIPHLAQFNAARQTVRRVAARDEIPAGAWPLIDRFGDQRLLIRDRRKDTEGKEVDVVEVAHEALLRQPPLSNWLAEDREFLVWRDRTSQARAAFAANERGLLAGRELDIARDWLQKREEAEQARAKEVAEREEQERRVRDAERIAEEQKKAAAAGRRTAQVAFAGLAVALIVAGLALWQYFAADLAKKDALAQRDRAVQAENAANKATQEAQANADQAKANLRDAQIAQSHFLADLAGRKRTAEGDAGTAALLALEALPDGATATARPYVADAELQLDGAWRELRDRRILGYAGMVLSAAFSPDGKRIVTATTGWTARIWDVATGQPIGQPLRGHNADVWVSAFSPDGKRVVTASNDRTARLWDATIGRPIGQPLTGHEKAVERAEFSPDGKRIVTASDDITARVCRSGAIRAGCIARRSAPKARASSPRPETRRRARGTLRPAGRSASRLLATESRSGARRSAPMANASSPRLRTRLRGCGTPRPASRSASR
jgi:hypothetical protein